MFWAVRNAYRCASEDTEFYSAEIHTQRAEDLQQQT